MTSAEIIAEVRARGYSLHVEGAGLRVIPGPDAALRALLVEHKAAILALLEAEANQCAGRRTCHRFTTAWEDAGQPFSRCLDCAHVKPTPVLRRDPRDASLEADRLLREGRWPLTLARVRVPLRKARRDVPAMRRAVGRALTGASEPEEV